MALVTQQNENVFKTKFTDVGGFIVTLLGLSLLALAERVLYDTGRLIALPPLDYFDNLGVIIVHAVVIICFLVVALVLNISLSHRKDRYAVALVPYFVVSIILCMQLLLQVSVYFINHHTTVQFYIVMLALIAVCTYGIYFVQSRHVVEGE
jgi:ABC-type xylose transport system permease subunit